MSAYEVAPLPHGRAGSPDPSLALRLRVYITRFHLDRQIATAGAGAASAALELRAQQLTCARTRLQLARNLRRVVEYVEHVESRPLLSTVVIEPRTVSDGQHALLGLAERLEAGGAVNPRGMVLVRRLLTDGLSPLFNLKSEQTVVEAIWDIEDALEERATIA
jgi:hypothetical protein